MLKNKSPPQAEFFLMFLRQKRGKVVLLSDFGSQNIDKNKKTERQIPGKVRQGFFFPLIMGGKQDFGSYFPPIIRDPGGKIEVIFPPLSGTLGGK